MPAYVRLQEEEFARQQDGYTAVRHQHEVGTAYFDKVLMTITGGTSSTAALAGSTEAAQFSNPLEQARNEAHQKRAEADSQEKSA